MGKAEIFLPDYEGVILMRNSASLTDGSILHEGGDIETDFNIYPCSQRWWYHKGSLVLLS